MVNPPASVRDVEFDLLGREDPLRDKWQLARILPGKWTEELWATVHGFSKKSNTT